MLGGELQLAFCCTNLVGSGKWPVFPRGMFYGTVTTVDIEILHIVVFQKQLQNEVIN